MIIRDIIRCHLIPTNFEDAERSYDRRSAGCRRGPGRFDQVRYDRLFATDPTLRPLFEGDMVVQGRRLMTMIETAVENVHQLEQILPAVRDLGRRHAGYGVKAEHYDTVAGALLATLEQALGSEFTPAVRDAWVAYYQTLAGEMKAAAPV